MRRLLLKGVKFEWGPEQEEKFNKIKEILSSDIVMGYPCCDMQDKYPFVILTDSSKYSIGGVLIQNNKVIEYYSRATKPYERMASANSLEIAGLVQCIIHWNHYLSSNHEFIILTDCKALLNLKSFKYSRNAKLVRYSVMLQHLKYKILHISGSKHTLADALSRKFEPRDDVHKQLLEDDVTGPSNRCELNEKAVQTDEDIFDEIERNADSKIDDELLNEGALNPTNYLMALDEVDFTNVLNVPLNANRQEITNKRAKRNIWFAVI